MQQISEGLRTALKQGGYSVAFRCDFYKQDSLTSPWRYSTTVYPSGGSISRSWESDVRSTFRVEFPTDFIPEETVVPGGGRTFGDLRFGDGVFGDDKGSVIRSIFDPLVSKVVITGEYKWAGGSEEVQLGKFTVESTEFSASPSGKIVSLSGSDVAADYLRQRFGTLLYCPATYDWRQSMVYIKDKLTLVPGTPAPDIPTPEEKLTLSTDVIVVPGTDVSPWTVLRRLGYSQSYNMFVGRDGGIKWEASFTRPQVLHSFADDVEIMEASWQPDAGEFCNRVAAYSSSVAGIYAVAEIKDGPYGVNSIGPVVRDEQTDLIGSAVAAENYANTMLWRYGRMNQSIEINLLPDPSVDPGDEFSVRVGTLGLGVNGDSVWSVGSMEFPLTVGQSMSITGVRRVQGMQQISLLAVGDG